LGAMSTRDSRNLCELGPLCHLTERGRLTVGERSESAYTGPSQRPKERCLYREHVRAYNIHIQQELL
jgi:hypothetical protein